MTEEVVNDVLAMLEVQEAEHPDGKPLTEWVFANDKTNPAVRNLFHMFHQAAFVNQLGFMVARDKQTGALTTLIVGVQQDSDGLNLWPMAKVLTETEQNNYEYPDGEGNYR